VEANNIWADLQKIFTDEEAREIVDLTTEAFERLHQERPKTGSRLKEETRGRFKFTAYDPLSVYVPSPQASGSSETGHVGNPPKMDCRRMGSTTKADGALEYPGTSYRADLFGYWAQGFPLPPDPALRADA
jgi:hypothetical protein